MRLTRDHAWRAIPLLGIFLLFIGCLIYTSPIYLDSSSGDPWYYVYAANSVREGKGLLNYDSDNTEFARVLGAPNTPFATWPPMYSFMLATLGGTFQSARILNAISLWGTFILVQ